MCCGLDWFELCVAHTSTKPARETCRTAHAVVDKADTIACGSLTIPMQSRHKNTTRRLQGWFKGIMEDTLTSISRYRGSVLALVNPAYTSQTDSRTGL